MRKLKLARSTRSIFLSLACLSLTIHLLLAFFCLSILQTACILHPSSSSSSTRDTVPVQHGSRPSPLDAEQHQMNVQGQRPAEEDPLGGNEKKLIGGGKAAQEVKGRSKLEALFRHPLYNQPRPQLQEDDWLLRVKTSQHSQDKGQEEEDTISTDSEWWVSNTVGNHRHGALIQDSQEENVHGDSTLRTGLECPGQEMFQSYNVALGGWNLSPRIFSPQAEHQWGGRLRQDGLDERRGHAPSLAGLPPGDHSLGAVRQEGSKPGSADSLPGNAADPRRWSACTRSPTHHQSFVYFTLCVAWVVSRRCCGWSVLWITATVVFVQARSRRSDLTLMPTVGAFKQTSTPEREPEVTLTRLCQGSYLELQECIFRSTQRMLDPGVSGDK